MIWLQAARSRRWHRPGRFWPVRAGNEVLMKQIPNATKPFWRLRANVPKRLTCTGSGNDALKMARQGANSGDDQCRNHQSPLPLFPFFMTPPAEAAPPPVAVAPSQDEGTVVMPARLKRQVVNYATREAP